MNSDRIFEAIFKTRSLLVLMVLFIVYATTVPFQFDRPPTLADADFIPFWDAERGRIHSIPDLVQNVLLFIPFGFLVLVTHPKSYEGPFLRAVLRAGLLGLALSGFVEALQTMSEMRRTSASDLATNFGGAALGAVLAWLYHDRYEVRAKRILREAVRGNPGLIVLAFLSTQLVLALWAPFIPSLDVGILRGQVKMVVVDPWGDRPLGGLFTEALLFGAFAFLAVRELPAWLRARGWWPTALPAGPIEGAVVGAAVVALAVVLELGQVPLVHHRPGLRELLVNLLGVALGTALGVWGARLWSAPARALGELTRAAPPLVLAYAVTLPVLRALAPFRFTTLAAGLERIDWARQLPFLHFFMKINPITMMNVVEAASAYLALGFALAALGRSTLASFGLALILAEVLEVLQIPVEGRTFDITEGILAASGALVGAYAYGRLGAMSKRPRATG